MNAESVRREARPLSTAEDLATALSISVESAQMEAIRLARQGLLTQQKAGYPTKNPLFATPSLTEE